jgi:hypothetical protein
MILSIITWILIPVNRKVDRSERFKRSDRWTGKHQELKPWRLPNGMGRLCIPVRNIGRQYSYIFDFGIMIGKIFEDEVGMAAMAGTKRRAIVGMRSLLMVMPLTRMKVYL